MIQDTSFFNKKKRKTGKTGEKTLKTGEKNRKKQEIKQKITRNTETRFRQGSGKC